MRGKGTVLSLQHVRSGITPAYAGKSRSFHICRHEPQDHPRLCGEKERVVALSVWTMGSPPPMRGKGDSGAVVCLYYRITPAYAGKSHRS